MEVWKAVRVGLEGGGSGHPAAGQLGQVVPPHGLLGAPPAGPCFCPPPWQPDSVDPGGPAGRRLLAGREQVRRGGQAEVGGQEQTLPAVFLPRGQSHLCLLKLWSLAVGCRLRWAGSPGGRWGCPLAPHPWWWCQGLGCHRIFRTGRQLQARWGPFLHWSLGAAGATPGACAWYPGLRSPPTQLHMGLFRASPATRAISQGGFQETLVPEDAPGEGLWRWNWLEKLCLLSSLGGAS